MSSAEGCSIAGVVYTMRAASASVSAEMSDAKRDDLLARGYGVAFSKRPSGHYCSVNTYLLLALVLSIASSIQGILSFDFGMITMSFMTMLRYYNM